MADISKLAEVSPLARLADNVRIGPFCVIGPDVEIADNCELKNNVTIQGKTRIGSDNIFYQNVVIGTAPQDLKYNGGPTETIIGNGNVFREGVTVHRGTELGSGRTIIGNNNLLMVGVHIAHDCIIHNNVIIGNMTQLAGHVVIEDYAVVSALIGLHHFVTVGKYSYVGGMTPVRRDVPPFMKFSGDPNETRGVNEEGLRRNGFSSQEITELKKAYKLLYRQNRIADALKELQADEDLNKHVAYLCNFAQASCQSRFGRYLETARHDSFEDRKRKNPFEIRSKNNRLH